MNQPKPGDEAQQPGARFTITTETFSDLLFHGHIVDGRAGGLLLGRLHITGNVNFLRFDGPDIIIAGCVQGGEYILNSEASAVHRTRLDEINMGTRQDPTDYSLPAVVISCSSRFLCTYAQPADKFLLLEAGQYIVNHTATAKHFAELEDMNFETNPRLDFRPSFTFTTLPGVSGGI